MSERNHDFLFKVIAIGPSGAGKSGLICKFLRREHNGSGTIGIDFFVSNVINVFGKRVKLQIWDTSGLERFKAVVAPVCRGSLAVLFVYSITSQRDFENMKRWHTYIETNSEIKFLAKIVVGTGADLAHQRCVSIAEAQEYAKSIGANHVETSILSEDSVDKIFFDLATTLLCRYKALRTKNAHNCLSPLFVPLFCEGGFLC
eukprot:m.236775 g.236775  ORF g.236775 m.236775 type:complete len:202 (-) comp15786_c0_seq8:486-1091(-)